MTADALTLARRSALGALRPPPRRPLSEWVEEHVHLPSSIAAQPGRMRLWPHQRAIADSIGDPEVERVSVLKSARVGYSQLLVAALGHFAVNDPGPVLVVVPAEADSRHFMTGVVEPTFSESPTLRAALKADAAGRDTMLNRFFPGGSLTVLSARSPRNLRARTARVLILDEVDAFEVDVRGEGDPVALAERRTATFANRKIVMGSTPVDEETSRVLRAYGASDMRVFEVPCPHCHDFHEVTWSAIRWDEGKPETAAWCCPGCGSIVTEDHKPAMVRAGHWRPTRPEVVGHHGYKLNALVSLLPNAAWSRLAAELLQAKRSPETLKAFVNTVLGEAWRSDGDEVDPASLTRLQRPYTAQTMPEDVLVLTAGCDLQDDRIEMSTVGWTRDGAARVLAHEIVWGSPLEDATWRDLDDLLRRPWPHPAGGVLLLDAALIDSGNWADAVYAFTAPRTSRRVVASKGVSGFARPSLAWGASRKTRLALIGVDAVKLAVHNRLTMGETITFAADLGPDYFEQIAAEKLTTRYRKGMPVREWVKISGRRNEAWDCLVYATAARQLVAVNLDSRADALAGAAPTAPRPVVARSRWLEG